MSTGIEDIITAHSELIIYGIIAYLFIILVLLLIIVFTKTSKNHLIEQLKTLVEEYDLQLEKIKKDFQETADTLADNATQSSQVQNCV